jgi:hypothetical protein
MKAFSVGLLEKQIHQCHRGGGVGSVHSNRALRLVRRTTGSERQEHVGELEEGAPRSYVRCYLCTLAQRRHPRPPSIIASPVRVGAVRTPRHHATSLGLTASQ